MEKLSLLRKLKKEKEERQRKYEQEQKANVVETSTPELKNNVQEEPTPSPSDASIKVSRKHSIHETESSEDTTKMTKMLMIQRLMNNKKMKFDVDHLPMPVMREDMNIDPALFPSITKEPEVEEMDFEIEMETVKKITNYQVTNPEKTTTTTTVTKSDDSALTFQSEKCTKSLFEATDSIMERYKDEEKPEDCRGTGGSEIPIQCNFLPIQFENNINSIFVYSIQFDPMIENIRFRNLLINKIFEKQDKGLGLVKHYDGTNLYIPRDLGRNLISETIEIDDDKYRVMIQAVKNRTDSISEHFFNTLFRRVMEKLQMLPMGKGLYDYKHPISIPQHKLEIWPGYVAKVHNRPEGLLLKLDVSHRVLNMETCLDVMKSIYQSVRDKSLFRDECEKVLIGCTIVSVYNNRIYKIDEIDWEKNPTGGFIIKDRMITFQEYYKKQYNITLGDMNQPLFVHYPKMKVMKQNQSTKSTPVSEPIILIPELMRMSGLRESLRSDRRCMKDLAGHLQLRPEQRQQALLSFARNVNTTPEAKKMLSDWNMKIGTNLLDLNARILPHENVIFGNNKRQLINNERNDWVRMEGAAHTVVQKNRWIILYTRRDETAAKKFCEFYSQSSARLGISYSQPFRQLLPSDQTACYVDVLRKMVDKKPDFIVIFFPSQREDRYAAVKRVLCTENAIPSQVVLGATIVTKKTVRTIVQNIILQINCKLGGASWAVQLPSDGLMAFGMDVYHHGPGMKKPSVAGIVSSLNPRFTEWYSQVAFQPPKTEIVDELKKCGRKALEMYMQRSNGRLPAFILFYRDGIGEQNFIKVRKNECEPFVHMVNELYKEYGRNPPEISYIIINKRINHRLLRINNNNNNMNNNNRRQNNCGRNERLVNPLPGMIVDHSITSETWMDFFLVSQCKNQGTVSPTHYTVLLNKSTASVNFLQQMAYKMSFLYYNWPGSISVPAPCQFAHRLASMVGQVLQNVPRPELQDKLFYL
ncbi:hypothetical protein SNEBB_004664 [Seison nebaliae]|nr:hypothetical protein SNEBB_004664 [Seison nebaliae]